MAGIIRQAISRRHAAPTGRHFAYYINDGVCNVFNTLLFNHVTVQPRWLRDALGPAPRTGDGAGGNDANGEDAALGTLTGGGGG